MTEPKRKPRTGRGGGIHHANIRDKKGVEKRLRAAFRKINVKLVLEKNAKPMDALAVLTEIDLNSAYLFSTRKLRKKTALEFHISQPLQMKVRAIVRYCERWQAESIVQMEADRACFRMFIEFIFANDSEARAMQDLYQKIRNDDYVPTQWHIYVTEKMQQEQRLRMQTEKAQAIVNEAKSEEATPNPAPGKTKKAA